MNHSIDHSHQDSDLFGLLYGFRFRPGEKGEQIDSARPSRPCASRPTRTSFCGCT